MNIEEYKKQQSKKQEFTSADSMKGDRPTYKNDGVAVWENVTKDGKKYLSIQLLGKNGIKINAFANED